MNKSPGLENVTSNLLPCGKLENQNKRGNFSDHVWIIQHNPCVEISHSHMVIAVTHGYLTVKVANHVWFFYGYQNLWRNIQTKPIENPCLVFKVLWIF